MSIFVDESGDFGVSSDRNSYYLVTMVFHDQDRSLTEAIAKYDAAIAQTGLGIEYVHTGPIIRREEVFTHLSIDERRKLLYKILHLYLMSDIHHITVKVPRREAPDKVSLSGKLAKQLKQALDAHHDFFSGYDKFIVYYDNGQSELSYVLNAVFSICFPDVEFRKAEPQNYRLLQLADFICSVELLQIKRDEKRLSKSEEQFFYKPQELKKTFLHSIAKKKL